MISVKKFYDLFIENNLEFFSGVPDSSLKYFLSYLSEHNPNNHVISANEGLAIAHASGYHLATNKIPVVYMQNSGMGNAINPITSLIDEEVYKIPMLLLIGWRGEPGKKDEPQHIKQGKVTLDLLKNLGIPYEIIDDNENETLAKTKNIIDRIKLTNLPHAIVARRGIFESYESTTKSEYKMTREDALKIITESINHEDIIVSTTGKLSRELYEYREEMGENHDRDFLTVGSMGHSSTIAFGIAKEINNRQIYCFDGDGALLMHSGAMANIGNSKIGNFKHIVFNNGAHESVGGQKTAAFDIDIPLIAKAFGYKSTLRVVNKQELIDVLSEFNAATGPSLLEVKVGMNSRKDLGRPKSTPKENKELLMNKLAQKKHDK